MRVVTFRIDEEMLKKLDHYARLRGLNRSEAIRRAIEEWLRRQGSDVWKPKIIRIYS